MKRWFIVFIVAFSMVILLSPCTPQAASPTAATTKADFYKDKIVTIVVYRPCRFHK